MANKRFLAVMPALALVFGMTVVGCDNGNGGGSDINTVEEFLK